MAQNIRSGNDAENSADENRYNSENINSLVNSSECNLLIVNKSKEILLISPKAAEILTINNSVGDVFEYDFSIFQSQIEFNKYNNQKIEISAKKIKWDGKTAFRIELTPIIALENGLEKVARLLPEILSHPGSYMYVFNGKTDRYDFVSPGYAQILGYTTEGLLSADINSFLEDFHPDDKTIFVNYLENLKFDTEKFKDQATLIYRRRIFNGEYCWFSDKLSVELNSEREIEYIAGTVFDISAQKLIDKKLIESQKQLHAFLIASNDGFFEQNLITNKAYYSPQWCQILGHYPSEIIPSVETWDKMIHPEDRIYALDALNDYLKGASSQFCIEFRMKTKNAGWKWVQCKAVITDWDEIGNPSKIIGVNKDIHRLKELEKDFHKFQNQYDFISKYSNEGVVIYDEKGHITEWSSGQERITGILKEEVLGKYIWEIRYKLLSDLQKTQISYEQLKVTVLEYLRTGDIDLAESIEFEEIVKRDKSKCYINAVHYPVSTDKGFIACSVYYDITKTKELTSQLEISDKLFKEVLANSNEAIFRIDFSEKKLDYISPSIVSITGLSAEYFLSSNLNNIYKNIHPEDLNTIINQFSESLSLQNNPSDFSFELIFRLLNSKGNYKHISCKYKLVKENNNNFPNYITGSLTDITEHIEKSEEIRCQKERYKLIVENQNDLIARLDMQGHYVWASPSYCDMFGKNEQELINSNYEPEIHIDDKFELIASIRSVKRDPYASYVELRMHTKFGWRWLAWSNRGLLNSNNELYNVLCVGRDITKQKRTEEALRTQRDFAEHIISTAKVIVVLLDRDGNIIRANSFLEKISGYTYQEIIGANWFTLFITPEEASFYYSEFKHLIESNLSDCYINAISTKDNDQLMIEWHTTILRDHNDNFSGFLAVGHDITEQISVENMLRDSENKFRCIVEQSRDGIFLTDEDGTILEWNKAEEVLFGYDRNEVIGKNILDILTKVNSNEDDHISDNLQCLINNDISIDESNIQIIERIIVNKNGNKCNVQTKFFPINLNGKTLFGSISRDIAKLKKIEHELRHNENLFKKAFFEAPFSMALFDNKKNIILANKGFYELTGYNEKEFSNIGIIDLSTNDDCDFNTVLSEKINKAEYETLRFENRLKRKNGTIADISIAISLIKDDTGFPDMFLFQAHDITDFKNTERALTESHGAISSIVSNLPLIITCIDPNGIITFNDGNAMPIMSKEPDKQIGKSIFDIHQGLENVIDDIKLSLLGNTVSAVYSFGPFSLETHYTPVFDKNGQLISVTIGSMDVSEKKKNENEMIAVIEELKKSKKQIEEHARELLRLNLKLTDSEKELISLNADKDKFFSIIAHDLRSPFHGFLNITNAFITELDKLSDEDIKDMSIGMYDSAFQLNKLLENLLQWAKLQRGLQENEPELLCIVDIIKNIEELFSIEFAHKNIKFNHKISSKLKVYVDAFAISTVLRNLISNALKFSEPGSEIIVSAEAVKNKVHISIQDFGIGMTESELDKLFCINSHHSKHGTLKEKGSGLGLILCKELLTINHGCIKAESKINEGSVFTIVLPAESE